MTNAERPAPTGTTSPPTTSATPDHDDAVRRLNAAIDNATTYDEPAVDVRTADVRAVLDELGRLRARHVAVHDLADQVQHDATPHITGHQGDVAVEVANARYDLAAAVRGTLRGTR